MCGIVGYIGPHSATDIILGGLRRLEYRGYDSAGIALVHDGRLSIAKAPGKLVRLDEKLKGVELSGHLGIGHTRWATHGVPNEANAHPHHDSAGEIAVVHNGIIENYRELRADLENEGVVFRSDTDSETLAHLIRRYFTGDLFEATRQALRLVRGAYAIGVVSSHSPDRLIAARSGSPLILGVGDGEHFVASDAPAIMNRTNRVVYLDDGQICEVHADQFAIRTLDGELVSPVVETMEWSEETAEKGGFPHFMLKEIYEQPDVLRRILDTRLDDRGDLRFDDVFESRDIFARCERIVIVGCGTAWHAGLVGRRLLESFAGMPVEIDIASEFRYRNPILSPNTVVIPVSQSGETADTMEAVRVAQANGARVLSVVNVVGSSIARMSDAVLYTHAGPEIGVASTKAYTSQLVAFALLALYWAKLRNRISIDDQNMFVSHLRTLPDKLTRAVGQKPVVDACAADEKYRDPRSAFFMGRGYNFPSALEGALKLKEISYIHAEGYAAGEMKHGPIALITNEVPMIGIATQSETYEKMISNIQEIRARDGIILSIATEGDAEIAKHSDDVLYVPECWEPLSPILNAIPLQLLAYGIATERGCDVDQPRNLAKSVTVE